MNKFDKHYWLTYLILSLLILIRLIPFLYPESRSWGFNHLIFLPTGYSIAFFALGIFALVLPLLKKSEIWGSLLAEWFSYNFIESSKRNINRFIFLAIMAVIFIVFLAPTHFLGDSYMYLKILEKVSGVYAEWGETAVFKWSEIGVAKFMIFVRSFIAESVNNRALLSFQIISVLSGIITLWFFIKISQVATKNKTKRILIIGSSVLSGALLMFFGYAEYYHIIWAFLTAYIYFCLKYISSAKGLIISWIVLLVGITFHLLMAIFIPASIYLTFCNGKGLAMYRRYKTIIRGLGVILVGGVGFGVISKYLNDLYIQDMFLTLFKGKPVDVNYAVFSLSHITDIFNEIVLITPLVFILFFAGITNIKNVLTDKRIIFLCLATIGGLLFLFLIDPQLAMPRDWDLFSLMPYPLLLLSIIMIPKTYTASLDKFIVPIIILLLISSIPFLMTNLNRDRSVKYFEYFIGVDTKRAHYSYIVLADYYRLKGEKNKADSLRIVYDKNYPQINQFNRVMQAMDNGNMKLAYTILVSIKPDKYDGDYHRVWGRYHYLQGDLIKALDYLDDAMQLRKYNSIYRWQRAMTYIGLSKNDRALDDLLQAYDLDNSSKRVLDGLSYLYYSNKKYDSSVYYADQLLKLDSSQIGAYYMLANSYYQKRDKRNSARYASMFLTKTEGSDIYARQREEMIKMLNTLQIN